MNQPDLLQPKTTSGKKRPGSEIHSNSDSEPSNATPLKTGTKLKKQLCRTTFKRFRRIFLYDIIHHSSESERISLSLSPLKDKSMCIMARPELESLVEHLKKQDMIRTQRILALNSGMATKVRRTLFSMNFEEELTYRTCSDGWIVIQSWWKSKEAREYLELRKFGSLQISTPKNGTLVSTGSPTEPSNED